MGIGAVLHWITMSKPPVPKPDGSVTVKVSVPRPIYLLLGRMAKTMGVSERAAMRMFLGQIGAMLEVGQAGFLGPVWARELKALREENFGVISAGPAIDLTVLHRSTKTKSGFVGVYANGSGFRAMAKIKGSEIYIGQFDSAEEAAWKRRLYYKEHRLPYGELEIDIAAWRARGEKGTDEELARTILEHSKMVGTLHVYEDPYGDGSAPTTTVVKEPGMTGIDPEAMERLLGGDS